MVHKVAFQLSSELVTLHLNNSITKAYLCNDDGTASPFSFQISILHIEYG